jgi:DNA-binding MarR family transcriptional regulator
MAEEPEGLGAFAALLQVQAAVVRRLEERLEDHRLVPIARYDVLLELNAAPDRQLTMSRLGEVAVVSRTRVSRVVDELERAGLVERVANPADRRSAFARITQAGRARLRAAAPTYLAGIERHFTSHLTEREAAVVASALEKVARATPASQ